MGYEFDYFCRLGHLPDNVQKEIRKMPLSRRRRMIILVELGVNVTMEMINEFNTLTQESDIDRFARKYIFQVNA